jgi:hypothetical protein
VTYHIRIEFLQRSEFWVGVVEPIEFWQLLNFLHCWQRMFGVHVDLEFVLVAVSLIEIPT